MLLLFTLVRFILTEDTLLEMFYLMAFMALSSNKLIHLFLVSYLLDIVLHDL